MDAHETSDNRRERAAAHLRKTFAKDAATPHRRDWHDRAADVTLRVAVAVALLLPLALLAVYVYATMFAVRLGLRQWGTGGIVVILLIVVLWGLQGAMRVRAAHVREMNRRYFYNDDDTLAP